MLEGILEAFLIRYFSKYLTGINSNNLSLGVWSGLISIENIGVNQQAVDLLGLPIKLVLSNIQKLTIKIPWKQILLTSVEITLEGIYIVLQPIHSQDWNQILQNNFKSKMTMIEGFAESYLNKIAARQMKQDSKSGLFQKILTKIIENLKINIRNIHIRFEDLDNQYFFGITLQSLSILNANQQPKSEHSTSEEQVSHQQQSQQLKKTSSNSSQNNEKKNSQSQTKKNGVSVKKDISLKNLSLYWSFCDDKQFYIHQEEEKALEQAINLQELSNNQQTWINKLDYLIITMAESNNKNIEKDSQFDIKYEKNNLKGVHPIIPHDVIFTINADINLQKGRSGNYEQPELKLEIMLDHLHLQIQKRQIQALIFLGEEVILFKQQYNLSLNYKRQIDPNKEEQYKKQFKQLYEIFRKNNCTLNGLPNDTSNNQKQQQQLQQQKILFEDPLQQALFEVAIASFDLDTLLNLAKSVVRKIEKEKHVQEIEKSKQNQGILSSLFQKKKPYYQLTEQERIQAEESFEQDFCEEALNKEDQVIQYPEDYNIIEIYWRLQHQSVEITNSYSKNRGKKSKESRDGMLFDLSEIEGEFQLKGRSQELFFLIGDINVYMLSNTLYSNIYTDSSPTSGLGNRIKKIVFKKLFAVDNSEHFVRFQFVRDCQSKSICQKNQQATNQEQIKQIFNLQTQSSLVIFDQRIINFIQRFGKFKFSNDQLVGQMQQQFVKFNVQAKQKIDRAINNNNRVNIIDFSISYPVILFPTKYNANYDFDGWLFNVGDFTIKTNSDVILGEMKNQANYDILLNNISLQYALPQQIQAIIKGCCSFEQFQYLINNQNEQQFIMKQIEGKEINHSKQENVEQGSKLEASQSQQQQREETKQVIPQLYLQFEENNKTIQEICEEESEKLDKDNENQQSVNKNLNHYKIIDQFKIALNLQFTKTKSDEEDNINIKIQGHLEQLKLNLVQSQYRKIMAQIFQLLQADKNQTINHLQKEIVIEQALEERKQIMKQAVKIGRCHRRGNTIKQWDQFYIVLSGNYLYFFQQKTDLCYKNYIYLKICMIQALQDQIQNDNFQNCLEFQQIGQDDSIIISLNSPKQMEEWIQVLSPICYINDEYIFNEEIEELDNSDQDEIDNDVVVQDIDENSKQQTEYEKTKNNQLSAITEGEQQIEGHNLNIKVGQQDSQYTQDQEFKSPFKKKQFNSDRKLNNPQKGNQKPVKAKKMVQVQFELAQFSFSLIEDKGKEFARFCANNLVLLFNQNVQGNFESSLKLQSLILEDMQEIENHEHKHFIKSQDGQQLIDIHIQSYDQQCPCYEDIDLDVQVLLGNLKIAFKPEIFYKLIKFTQQQEDGKSPPMHQMNEQNSVQASQVFTRSNSMMSGPSNINYINQQNIHQQFSFNENITMLESTPSINLQGLQRQQSFNTNDQVKQAQQQYDSKRIILQASLQIKQISVVLINQITSMPLIETSIINMNAQFKLLQTKMILKGDLGNLQIFDLTNFPNTIYKKEEVANIQKKEIVGLKQGHKSSLLQFDMQFLKKNNVLTNKSAFSSAQKIQYNQLNMVDSNDMLISIMLSQIQVTYQHQSVMRYIDYIKHQIVGSLNDFITFQEENLLIIKNSEFDSLNAKGRNEVVQELEKPKKVKINILIQQIEILMFPTYSRKQADNLPQEGQSQQFQNQSLIDYTSLVVNEITFENEYIEEGMLIWDKEQSRKKGRIIKKTETALLLEQVHGMHMDIKIENIIINRCHKNITSQISQPFHLNVEISVPLFVGKYRFVYLDDLILDLGVRIRCDCSSSLNLKVVSQDYNFLINFLISNFIFNDECDKFFYCKKKNAKKLFQDQTTTQKINKNESSESQQEASFNQQRCFPACIIDVQLDLAAIQLTLLNDASLQDKTGNQKEQSILDKYILTKIKISKFRMHLINHENLIQNFVYVQCVESIQDFSYDLKKNQELSKNTISHCNNNYSNDDLKNDGNQYNINKIIDQLQNNYFLQEKYNFQENFDQVVNQQEQQQQSQDNNQSNIHQYQQIFNQDSSVIINEICSNICPDKLKDIMQFISLDNENKELLSLCSKKKVVKSYKQPNNNIEPNLQNKIRKSKYSYMPSHASSDQLSPIIEFKQLRKKILHINVSFESTNILFINKITKLPIAEVMMSNCGISFNQQSDQKKLTAQINDYQIFDMTNYPNTITQISDKYKIVKRQIIGRKQEEQVNDYQLINKRKNVNNQYLLKFQLNLKQEKNQNLIESNNFLGDNWKQTTQKSISKKLFYNKIDINIEVYNGHAYYYQQPILRLIDYCMGQIMGTINNFVSFQNFKVIVDKYEHLRKMGFEKVKQLIDNPKQLRLEIVLHNTEVILKPDPSCPTYINLIIDKAYIVNQQIKSGFLSSPVSNSSTDINTDYQTNTSFSFKSSMNSDNNSIYKKNASSCSLKADVIQDKFNDDYLINKTNTSPIGSSDINNNNPSFPSNDKIKNNDEYQILVNNIDPQEPSNYPSQNRGRLLQSGKSHNLEFVYSQLIKIAVSNVQIKLCNKKALTQAFHYTMCIDLPDLINHFQFIYQDELVIDQTVQIHSLLTPVVVMIEKSDYEFLMLCIFRNIAFNDGCNKFFICEQMNQPNHQTVYILEKEKRLLKTKDLKGVSFQLDSRDISLFIIGTLQNYSHYNSSSNLINSIDDNILNNNDKSKMPFTRVSIGQMRLLVQHNYSQSITTIHVNNFVSTYFEKSKKEPNIINEGGIIGKLNYFRKYTQKEAMDISYLSNCLKQNENQIQNQHCNDASTQVEDIAIHNLEHEIFSMQDFNENDYQIKFQFCLIRQTFEYILYVEKSQIQQQQQQQQCQQKIQNNNQKEMFFDLKNINVMIEADILFKLINFFTFNVKKIKQFQFISQQQYSFTSINSLDPMNNQSQYYNSFKLSEQLAKTQQIEKLIQGKKDIAKLTIGISISTCIQNLLLCAPTICSQEVFAIIGNYTLSFQGQKQSDIISQIMQGVKINDLFSFNFGVDKLIMCRCQINQLPIGQDFGTLNKRQILSLNLIQSNMNSFLALEPQQAFNSTETQEVKELAKNLNIQKKPETSQKQQLEISNSSLVQKSNVSFKLDNIIFQLSLKDLDIIQYAIWYIKNKYKEYESDQKQYKRQQSQQEWKAWQKQQFSNSRKHSLEEIEAENQTESDNDQGTQKNGHYSKRQQKAAKKKCDQQQKKQNSLFKKLDQQLQQQQQQQEKGEKDEEEVVVVEEDEKDSKNEIKNISRAKSENFEFHDNNHFLKQMDKKKGKQQTQQLSEIQTEGQMRQQNIDVISSEMHFDIHFINNFQIVLIDDINKFFSPLFKIKLLEVNVLISQGIRYLKFFSQFDISIRSFNSFASVWEPVIERVGFNIEMLASKDDQIQKQIIINLRQGCQSLNINLSSQFYFLAQKTIQTFKQMSKIQLQNKYFIQRQQWSTNVILAQFLFISNYLFIIQLELSQNIIDFTETDVSPYIIKNLTGYKIAIQCSETKREKVIQNNQCVQFAIDTEKNMSQFYFRQKKEIHVSQYSVKIVINDQQSIYVPLNKFMVRYYNMQNLALSAQYMLDPATNCKMLCILGQFIFQNESSLTSFQLLFDNQKEQILEKNGEYPVPFDKIDSKFAIKFLDEPQVSEFISIKKLLHNKYSYCTVYVGIKKIILNLVKDPQNKLLTIIKVQPCYRFVNKLPVSILIEIFQQGFINLQEHILYPNESVEDYIHCKKSTNFANIQINNLQCTKSFNLNSNKSNKIQTVQMLDDKNLSYTVQIVSHRLNKIAESCEEFYFYSPVYIQNQTCFDMDILVTDQYYTIIENEVIFPHEDVTQIKMKGNKNNIVSVEGVSGGQQIQARVQQKFNPELGRTFYTVLNIILKRKKTVSPLYLYTREIVILPKYVIVNQCDENIYIRRYQDEQDYKINSKSRFPLMKYREWSDTQMSIGIHNIIMFWSDPQEVGTMGEQYFELRGCVDGQVQSPLVMRSQCRENNDIMYIILQRVYDNKAPFVIRNVCNKVNLFASRQGTFISPGKEISFAWNEKSPFNIFIKCVANKHKEMNIKIPPNQVSWQQIITLRSKQKNIDDIYLSISLEVQQNTKRVIVEEISKQNGQNVQKQKLLMQQKKNSEWQIMDLQINARIPVIGISLIKNHINYQHPVEYIYIVLQKNDMVMQRNKYNKTITQFKIQFINIDNNISDTSNFPVFLTPQKYQAYQKFDSKLSVINAMIIQNNCIDQINIIETCRIQVDPLTIKCDFSFINYFSELMSLIISNQQGSTLQQQQFMQQNISKHVANFKNHDQQQQYQLDQNEIYDWQTNQIPQTQKITYINEVIVSPIKINVSIQSGKGESLDKLIFIDFFPKPVRASLLKIDEAPIMLKGIKLNNCYDSIQSILDKLRQIYMDGALHTLLSVVGSANILGNPVGLVNKLQRGVIALYEKPIEGFIQGPIETGLGVIGGAGAFFKNTIEGTFNSVEKFAGSISSGLATISMDQQFIKNRDSILQKKPKHIGQGLAQGVELLLNGIVDGSSGVITQPIQFAQKEGIQGFFKGALIGVTGLIVKPVTGLFDSVSQTAQGVKNTATLLDDKANEVRLRSRRAFYLNNYYKKFNSLEAYSNQLLNILNDKKYANNKLIKGIVYLPFIENKKQKNLMLLSVESFICYKLYDEQVAWIIETNNIIYPQFERVSDGIMLSLKQKSNFFKNLKVKISLNSKLLNDLCFDYMKLALTLINDTE